MTLSQTELLARYPGEHAVSADAIRACWEGAVLIVSDDDPTGTQAVRNVIVLTSWQIPDFEWAYAEIEKGHGPPAVFVETNSRSLGPQDAAERNAEIVRNSIAAARHAGIRVRFASRSDSTLRGHFPAETDVIAATLAELGEPEITAVLLAMAFPEAGRVTIGGVHYLRGPGDQLVGAGESEFARDASFSYRSSRLADYAVERSGREIKVTELDLHAVRAGPDAVAGKLLRLANGSLVAVDSVCEDDLRAVALGALRSGTNFLPRCGPSFVRALIGQAPGAPLTRAETRAGSRPCALGGLIVVGSHVSLSTRQLEHLRLHAPGTVFVEMCVDDLFDATSSGTGHSRSAASIAASIAASVAKSNVVLYSSRTQRAGQDAASSLRIARTVSRGLTRIVAEVVDAVTPRFVIAKGGITSHDIARDGLRMRRAVVAGCLQPGIVALWRPADGPVADVPYAVFPGNVGDDTTLVEVVDLLSSPQLVSSQASRGEAR
jgi:uncharacterized protein YgbK (DUF1537 family)